MEEEEEGLAVGSAEVEEEEEGLAVGSAEVEESRGVLVAVMDVLVEEMEALASS